MKPVLDARGNVAYYIQENLNETLVFDASGNLVYRYIKAQNVTLDNRGNLYMYGNIVLTLK